MKSRPSDLVIATVARQLDESIDMAEAMKDKLLVRIEALQLRVAEQQQEIEHKRRMREYLHNGFDDLLRPVVDACAVDASNKLDRRPDTARKSAVASGGESADHGHEHNSDRVYQLITSKPNQVWIARQVQNHLPDIKIEAIRNILQRLYKRGKIDRPEKGKYQYSNARLSTSADEPRIDDASSDQSSTTAQDSLDGRVGGSDPNQEGQSASLGERIIGTLGSQAGRSWQLATLAEAVDSSATAVHATLQGLLRTGEVVTAIDGGYLVPAAGKAAAAN